MKIHLFLLLLAFTACGTSKGDLIAPPDGMKESVANHFAPKNIKLKGMSVRQYPKGVYYVTADVEPNPSDSSNLSVYKLIVQKAFNDNGEYWQVEGSNKHKREILGIENE